MADVKKIEFSKEASIGLGSDFYSSFQRNSYLARVEYDDGFVVINVLPRGAAQQTTQSYLEEVVDKSDQARSLGVGANVWED